MTQKDIDSLIYTRADALSAAVKYIEQAREMVKRGYGLHFPIPEIANTFPIPPILPPKVVTVQAQSHNGKSAFLSFWKDNLAERLQKNPNPQNIIISVSLEDMIEEEMAVLLLKEAAKGNTKINTEKMDDLLVVSTMLGATPFYHIGKSIERSDRNTPDLSMSNIGQCIYTILERRKANRQPTKVQAVFLDYINAVEEDDELMSHVVDKKRNMQVRKDFFYFRDVLMPSIPAPGVVAVQSKQTLGGTLGPNMQCPGLYDMQETSAIPQHTDYDFSLWMPKRNLPFNEVVSHGKSNTVMYRVVENLCFLRCNKQRGYDLTTLKRLPADMYWPLKMDFDTGEYSLWTMQGTLDHGLKLNPSARVPQSTMAQP